MSDLKDCKLYVWHDHIKPLFSELNMDARRQIVVEVSQKTAANNQQYLTVEHAFQIGNVCFVDNKPG
jgi:hypothetical protein